LTTDAGHIKSNGVKHLLQGVVTQEKITCYLSTFILVRKILLQIWYFMQKYLVKKQVPLSGD
jgi:hypothetical protein